MANLNFSFTPEVGYTGVYRVIAYAASAPAIPVSQQDFSAPHPNPRVGTLPLPTFEDHTFIVYARLCNDKVVGTAQIVIPVP